MDINKYIDWAAIWEHEVQIELVEEFMTDESDWKIVQQFKGDDKVKLEVAECEMQDDELLFVFGEQGGQNESDNQGWDRTYWFKVAPKMDFAIQDSNYGQG